VLHDSSVQFWLHEPQLTVPPHPSEAEPHFKPSDLQLVGVHDVPDPPPEEHTPQFIVPPHPSGHVPHVLPSDEQFLMTHGFITRRFILCAAVACWEEVIFITEPSEIELTFSISMVLESPGDILFGPEIGINTPSM
jgi:hypothetical protein